MKTPTFGGCCPSAAAERKPEEHAMLIEIRVDLFLSKQWSLKINKKHSIWINLTFIIYKKNFLLLFDFACVIMSSF